MTGAGAPDAFLATLGAQADAFAAAVAFLAVLVPPPFNGVLTTLVVLPYVAFFVATLHIADYVSYREVFHPGEK